MMPAEAVPPPDQALEHLKADGREDMNSKPQKPETLFPVEENHLKLFGAKISKIPSFFKIRFEGLLVH